MEAGRVQVSETVLLPPVAVLSVGAPRAGGRGGAALVRAGAVAEQVGCGDLVVVGGAVEGADVV